MGGYGYRYGFCNPYKTCTLVMGLQVFMGMQVASLGLQHVINSVHMSNIQLVDCVSLAQESS